MMENYDMTWRMTQELLEEPDGSDLYNLFEYITFARPYLECDHMPIVWFRKTYDYLEYIRENTTLNSDKPNDNLEDSNDELMEPDDSLSGAYGTLGRYFWYSVRDCEYALLCYQREMNLIKSRMNDTEDGIDVIDLGEIYQRMADVYCEIDTIKAVELYEQAIHIFSKYEESCSAELAVCWSRIAYFQNEKYLEYFQRAFHLLLTMTSSDIYDIIRNDISECYLYLAKKYAAFSLSNHQQMALKWSQQALRLYLIRDGEILDRDLDNYVELILNIHTNMNRK